MFKVGDKIVCVKSIGRTNNNVLKNKIYIVKNEVYTVRVNDLSSTIYLEGIKYYGFDTSLFVSLNELRRNKIKKICSKLETK